MHIIVTFCSLSCYLLFKWN